VLVVLVALPIILTAKALVTVRELGAGIGLLMPFQVFSEYILEGNNNSGMGSAYLSSQARLNDLLHSLHLVSLAPSLTRTSFVGLSWVSFTSSS